MSDLRPLPERPRLVEWVLARMHAAGGTRKVLLHDPRTRQAMEIAADDWRILEHADGTRDVDGLQLAVARVGGSVSEAEVLELLRELNAAGVLADGLVPPPVLSPVSAGTTPRERPIEALPDYRLTCDGAGSCCRLYGSVGFSPVEALRARVVAEDIDLHGLDKLRLFLPVSGGDSPDPEMPVAVAQVDGRCAFLEDDRRCAIHARAGAAAKPFACASYPASFVDDGVALRVSVAPECSCVFGSVGVALGHPLVDGAATRGDLDARVPLLHVPDPVPLTLTKTAPRAALHEWSKRMHDHARDLEGDAAGWAWALAGSLERDGFGSVEVAPLALEGIEAWLDALRTRAEEAATTQESWRGEHDLSRRVARWIADSLAAPDPNTKATDPDAERFYLAALGFGHRLAVEGRPMAHGLRDRAARIVTARSMALTSPLDDSSARHPLALLEATMRNLGIASYMDE